MFSTIIIVVVGFIALANVFRPGRGELITRRPYNNRYNPASGARDRLDERE